MMDHSSVCLCMLYVVFVHVCVCMTEGIFVCICAYECIHSMNICM